MALEDIVWEFPLKSIIQMAIIFVFWDVAKLLIKRYTGKIPRDKVEGFSLVFHRLVDDVITLEPKISMFFEKIKRKLSKIDDKLAKLPAIPPKVGMSLNNKQAIGEMKKIRIEVGEMLSSIATNEDDLKYEIQKIKRKLGINGHEAEQLAIENLNNSLKKYQEDVKEVVKEMNTSKVELKPPPNLEEEE
jgi:hypothetical protein